MDRSVLVDEPRRTACRTASWIVNGRPSGSDSCRSGDVAEIIDPSSGSRTAATCPAVEVECRSWRVDQLRRHEVELLGSRAQVKGSARFHAIVPAIF